MSGHQTPEELKNLGNKFFRSGRYQEAIDAYSKAIIRSPETATYFTNRALCFYQSKQWEMAVADCRKAADLDRKSIKAYYFWGRAAIQLELFDEAIKLLTLANELAHGQQVNYGDEITSQLRLARREKFHREETIRISQEIELQSYVNRLIDEDLERQLKALTEEQKKSEDEEAMEQAQEDEGERLIREGKIEELPRNAETAKDKLNAIFAQVDDRRCRREIPDYLCGKISFELLQDPVITPSGITYDRNDIREHLQRVGHFDPVTRAPLKEEELIPNLAMREVIDNFIAENQWALHDNP